MQDKFDVIVKAVNDFIPQEFKHECKVIVQEVKKTNDTTWHGIMIRYPNRNVFPTLYLEDLAKLLDEGMPLDDLVSYVFATSLLDSPNPKLPEYDFSFDSIKDSLTCSVVEGNRNNEQIDGLVHKATRLGFDLVAYIIEDDGHGGLMRLPITKELAKGYGYNEEEILSVALHNTMKRFEPCLLSLLRISCDKGRRDFSHARLYSKDFVFEKDDGLYVLTNQECFFGATVLFYPELIEKLAEVFEEDFYVIPSSLHETILVKESISPSIEDLHNMVRSVNRDIVAPKDVLSDRVFKYDAKQGELIAV